MISGGGGIQREVKNEAFLKAFKALAGSAPQVAAICTGSAVLANGSKWLLKSPTGFSGS